MLYGAHYKYLRSWIRPVTRILCGRVTIIWPSNHPLSQSVDWIPKGAAQRGRTEVAVLSARHSAPEHDPCMTSEHRTTVIWIRLGVAFEEAGNRSAWRKPSKSGWDQLKLNPHTTFVVEVEGVNDVHYASLTSLTQSEGTNEAKVDKTTATRSRWAWACNSHTKSMSRHFYRLIHF